MKVVLLGDVKSLGGEGDIVDVAEGYAMNFLFPQHLAVEATDVTIRNIKEKEQAAVRRSSKQEKEEKKLVASIDGEDIVISAKADGGTLYASVGVKEIVEALKEKGCKIDPAWIRFDSTKDVGSYEVGVVTPGGFEAAIHISIESK
ncbi:50S ribosomal protein L9 [Patescibacteria group bacterium]|nr:50S ribosomal protein L9 [Patescibacteria group bacterium]